MQFSIMLIEFHHGLCDITGIEIITLNEYSFLEFKVHSLFEGGRVARDKRLYFNQKHSYNLKLCSRKNRRTKCVPVNTFFVLVRLCNTVFKIAKKKKRLIVLSIEQKYVLAKINFCKLFNYFILYSLPCILLGASYLKLSERPLFRSGLFLECLSVFLYGGGGTGWCFNS